MKYDYLIVGSGLFGATFANLAKKDGKKVLVIEKRPNNKLLIIKDSYANCFLPFLTSHYGEINVVDLRYFYDDLNTLIENKEITDILFLYNANTFNSDDSILNIGM